MHRHASNPLHAALGSFLEGFRWDHFHTLTFRQESGDDYARREWWRYQRHVEHAAGVATSWFYGIEFGERFGRVHIHALTANTERLPRSLMAAEWRAGFSRILDYDAGRGASHYVAKYVTKELAEWDLSPDPEAADAARTFRAPARDESRRLAMRERGRGIVLARLRATVGSLTAVSPIITIPSLLPAITGNSPYHSISRTLRGRAAR